MDDSNIRLIIENLKITLINMTKKTEPKMENYKRLETYKTKWKF